MYLPRSLISHLYTHLVRNTHPLSPPVLLLVALEPDALCACRILAALLKRDYIQHKIQPIAGYSDLARAGQELVKPMRTTDGGAGGVVVCLGVGGLVDLEQELGLEQEGMGGVSIWLVDARRPWHLSNIFGGGVEVVQAEQEQDEQIVRRERGVEKGRVDQHYRPDKGGIVVLDDGDIEEEMEREREAYCALLEMPEAGEDGEDPGSESDASDADDGDRISDSGQTGRKRKSLSDRDDDSETEDDDDRPRQRRRSNSSSPIPSSPERPPRRGLLSVGQHRTSSDTSRSGSARSSASPPPVQAPKQPSARTLRRRLRKLRDTHNDTLEEYYRLGTSYSEPISSLMYSLASELGREDNDLLWHAIVGVSSVELAGQTLTGLGLSPLSTSGGSSGWNGDRGERVRVILRDEVRRLNPADLRDYGGAEVIPTHARSPTDTSIRLSPEPRFLLIRHWSLYDSMLHSPYLSAKLHLWSDAGRRRLHKLLAKMGVSLTQCKQNYTHMDMELKRGLREKLLKFAPVYGMEGLLPPQESRGKIGWGFVRSWGWKACLSAIDVGVVVGAILEVGDSETKHIHYDSQPKPPQSNYHEAMLRARRAVDTPQDDASAEAAMIEAQEHIAARFWTAYDALSSVALLTTHIPTAQHLHRAILETGSALIEKKQIRHLRAFRMAVVKDGPHVALFTHPGALTKLALWIGEAIGEMEGSKGRRRGVGELVMAALDESRGAYVVVGLGGGGGAVGANKEREKRKEEKRKAKEKRREERRAENERQKQAERDRRAANGMDSDDEDDDEEVSEEEDDSGSDSEEEDEGAKQRGYGRNNFANAFHAVIAQTEARTRVDSFEHCVVEVKKEDLGGFLEALSMKTVVG